MYAFTFALPALALAVLTGAITVKSPTEGQNWASGTAGQTVSWQAVDTDSTSFSIQLVNQAGYLSNSPVTLNQNQSTGSANQVNSVTVNYPSGTWPTGKAFQINLVGNNNAILAQSPQFNITDSGSVSTTSSSSSSASSTGTSTAPTTISGGSTTSTGVMTVTSAEASGDASGGIPNASATSSKGAGYSTYQTSGFVSILIGAAGLIGVTL